jgi:hypothetical protein
VEIVWDTPHSMQTHVNGAVRPVKMCHRDDHADVLRHACDEAIVLVSFIWHTPHMHDDINVL